MSYRTGPKIVTDGLVLCLDAADRNSYPGSGSTWYDLSGQSNDFTINGPTFSSLNNGCFSFNGSADYMRKTTSGIITNSVTIETWFYLSQTKSYHGIFGSSNTERYEMLVKGTYQVEVSLQSSNWAQYNNQLALNNWYNFTLSATNGSQWKMYKNGNDLGNPSNSSGTWQVSGAVTYLDIGRLRNNTLFTPNGLIPIIKVYNRALSASEVLQNYNATKGRFGL
jgi:hypothetical protein